METKQTSLLWLFCQTTNNFTDHEFIHLFLMSFSFKIALLFNGFDNTDVLTRCYSGLICHCNCNYCNWSCNERFLGDWCQCRLLHASNTCFAPFGNHPSISWSPICMSLNMHYELELCCLFWKATLAARRELLKLQNMCVSKRVWRSSWWHFKRGGAET